MQVEYIMQNSKRQSSMTGAIRNFCMKPSTNLCQFIGLLIICLYSIPINAADSHPPPPLQLKVIDPYIELHTGPGVGYPIFYTIEQGDNVIVLTKRTAWYELKTLDGQTGWAKASQVARTLLPTGEPVDLPSISYGDYLKNSWRVGFKAGEFTGGELSGSDTFSYSVGFRPLSWAGVELEFGNFFNSEIKGSYQSLNILFEPYSEWKLSPVIIVGKGSMKLDSQPELLPLNIDKNNFTTYGISVNYYIGRNFVLNSGFQKYTLSTDFNDERLERWNIGFNAFF